MHRYQLWTSCLKTTVCKSKIRRNFVNYMKHINMLPINPSFNRKGKDNHAEPQRAGFLWTQCPSQLWSTDPEAVSPHNTITAAEHRDVLLWEQQYNKELILSTRKLQFKVQWLYRTITEKICFMLKTWHLGLDRFGFSNSLFLTPFSPTNHHTNPNSK